MSKNFCDRCRVSTPKGMSHRLYSKYWVCEKCREEWHKGFGKLRLKYPEKRGWRQWEPVFVQWLNDSLKERVIFT